MTQMKNQTFRSNIDILEYSQIIAANLDIFLNYFDIKFQIINRRYSFPCPVHESDNYDSCCVYNNGYTWKCFTKSCHEDIGKPLFFLIKKLLEKNNNKEVSYKNTEKFINDLTKDFDKTSIQKIEVAPRIVTDGLMSREQARSKLKIPSQFFLQKGFSKEILDKYDVGDCLNNKVDMKYRIVVPVYNDEYTKVVGCIGRTKNDKCSNCGKYHYGTKCPSNAIEYRWASKWIVSKNFKIENYFYNFWFAKNYIIDSKTAILVEGQSDVWRLEEAGIKNSLGLFGARLTHQQQQLLDSLGIYNIIIATDNDDTGNKVSTNIMNKLNSFYNKTIIKPTAKDFGDMSVSEIKNLFKGKI